MKPFLVDVPVMINIWIRPECQRRQFEVIKVVRPSILFLVSDGGRNETEWKMINENRLMFDDEIDWECSVHKIYEVTNQGIYAMIGKSYSKIWSIVDRCIMLEDDILPSKSFFRYCADLLERYKDDERISVICGMNHLGQCSNVDSDYFFSRQGSIWGTATWKRTYDRFYDFSYGHSEYVMSILKDRTRGNREFWNRIRTYATSKYCEGHVAGPEFFYEFGVYGQNQLQIIPKKNLISNLGYGVQSTHSSEFELMPKGLRKIFDMQIHEIEFPLMHAEYVIPDVDYEKKRNKVIGYNTPLIYAFRWIETKIYALAKEKSIIRLVMRRINRKRAKRDNPIER